MGEIDSDPLCGGCGGGEGHEFLSCDGCGKEICPDCEADLDDDDAPVNLCGDCVVNPGGD